MKNAILLIVGLFVLSQVSLADEVCTSEPSDTGGTISATISTNRQGQPTVSLFAQGGRAHFVSSEGPYVATVDHQGFGVTVYSFTDQFGQKDTLTVITTFLDGRVYDIASSDLGLWKNSSMFCK
jgi:hypothetical protein